MDLKETEILGPEIEQHWYYKSKARALTRLLAGMSTSTVLDVGAGSGFFSEHLLKHSVATAAWCVDMSYEHNSDAVVEGKPLHFRHNIGSVDADLVLLMDVLEHVDDDVGLLREYANKVPSGATFLISVPAFMFLWSDHDTFLDHKRRYTLAQIEGVVRQADLRVKHGSYYFGAVFPIAAAIRLSRNLVHKGRQKIRSQLTPHQPFLNASLSAISKIELPLLAHNRLAGLTAFCLAEKL